jgi:hypothetical protein
MNDDKIQRQITEMGYAAALIGNEFLWKQFDYLKEQYIAAWQVTPARDTDGRERLWQAVQVVGKVRDHLTKVLNDGKLAKQDIERLASKQG